MREATQHDLEAVLALQREDSFHSFSEPEHVSTNQRAAFAEIDADPQQQLLVGTLDEDVVTTAHVTWIRCWRRTAVCTARSRRCGRHRMRGRGIGAQLMSVIEDEARRRGAARIQLTSNQRRADAHRFYERLGYEPTHVGMKKYLT